MKRRAFFLTTTLAAAGVAGCLGSDGDSGNGDSSNGTDSGNGNETGNGNGDDPEPVEAAFVWSPEAPDTGEEITLDASESTGDIESYEWDLPERTATGRAVVNSFEQPREYEVQLIIIDSDGESAIIRARSTASTQSKPTVSLVSATLAKTWGRDSVLDRTVSTRRWLPAQPCQTLCGLAACVGSHYCRFS